MQGFETTATLFAALGQMFQLQDADSLVARMPKIRFPELKPGMYSDAIPDTLSTPAWSEHLRQVAVPGSEWLEFGCGPSTHKRLAEVCHLNWRGLDIESAGSKRRQDTAGVTYYDGLIIPFENATFDVVTSVQVFEHVHEPSTSLGEIARILKPGGYLLGSTSMLESFHTNSTFMYTPQNFTRLVEGAGLHLEVISPGVDGLALLLRRVLRDMRHPEEPAAWPSQFFKGDSPLHHLIAELGRRQRISPKRINALRLEVTGHFHFRVRKPF